MANPRKFSEKIALHNQKQAEETAAFEAILRDVSVATRGAYQNQHLHIQQNLNLQYRAGSLPNVNQLATNSSIDLQTALQHLENMQSGRNIHTRDRGRHAGAHRRTFVTDKSRTDCSPYSSIYLSPPADTSWRRTNSDSALHTSTMAPTTENFHSPTTPPPHRRILEMVGENSMADGAVLKAYWDPKKVELAQSRPKSCEVPNINIYPSTEQDSGIHIPISNSTTGSLPDLTVLHFPSPLTKPIDAEDQNYGGPLGSPVNLSPTSAHHMGGMVPPQHQGQQAQSPGQRRRHQGSPSPLVLTGNSSQQMRIPHSPPVSNLDPSKLTMDPRLRQQYMLYTQQQQQRHPGAQSQTFTRPPHPSIVRQQQPIPQVCITSMCNGTDPQASMTQYRNSVPEPGCQSPTSPLSQTSYSPAQSPGLPPASWDNSPFGESYTLQQTNALQHQFEQFNMLQENQTSADSNLTNCVNSALYTTPQSTFSQAIQVLNGNQEFQQQYYSPQPQLDMNTSHPCINSISLQQHQQQHHQQQQVSPQTPNNNIPDIVFTGADDALIRQDFAKDLGNAITGFDTDLFPSDEVLKAGLDPLDLDGLQMLTDPTMVTDPATEDSFRLDRL